MSDRQLPYPPPWQDCATVCAHLCISESTLDNWIKREILPAARMVGGKRMWKWAEIERALDGEGDTLEQDLASRIYHATKAAAAR